MDTLALEQRPLGRSTWRLSGPAGAIELLLDRPAATLRGLALITHPHPLLGGSAQHPLPHHLASAASEAGWLAVRPNFRGVGGSEGTHDHGVGETQDMLTVVDALRTGAPGLPLALVGFSFGAFVQAQASAALLARGAAAERLFLASLPYGLVQQQRHYDTLPVQADAVLVHGERDRVAPLAAVLDYARPLQLPVTVLPGTGHLLDGYLPRLRQLLQDCLSRHA